MEIGDKTIREILVILVVILFGVLVFFAIKPLIPAVIWGLLLAYIFYPLYLLINKYLKNRTFASLITLLMVALIILIPLWFILPAIIKQIFEIFTASQKFNTINLIKSIFPSISTQFSTQITSAINVFIGKATSLIMSGISNFLLNIPLLLVNIFIVAFVFFFSLRDSEKLKGFIKGISPLNKIKEKLFVKNFKDITYSIVYGRVIVGIVQGILAGIGFFAFGVPNALILSLLGIFLSILPILGVFLIWIPIAIYMFVSGNIALAIAFLLYNLVIVSQVDNLLFAYFVSRRTNLNALFTLISCIGGLYLFGIIGIVLGPLIFAYFIILIDLYREKNLLTLFSSDSEVKEGAKTP